MTVRVTGRIVSNVTRAARLGKFLNIAVLALLAGVLGGCSNLRGARLLMPESSGLTPIARDVYIESGADEQEKTALLDAVSRAQNRIHAVYGSIQSHPVINACITEDCYKSYGGMGSRAKVYGNHILLSPRGFNWHFLAHEWSHDELRTRLAFLAWWHVPQWFDEGLAVAISAAPEHSESHWQYLVAAGVPRPTRAELLTYRSLRQWLAAVHRYGETQNAQRRARGEPEVRPVYTAAGHEVRPWLAAAGGRGLRELIRRLNNGEAFEAAYSATFREHSAGPATPRPERHPVPSGG